MAYIEIVPSALLATYANLAEDEATSIVTVNAVDPVIAPLAAVIVAPPAEMPVAIPAGEMLATPGADELHVTAPVTS
jgi:hypothetical protein